jgi:hypothetical protein
MLPLRAGGAITFDAYSGQQASTFDKYAMPHHSALPESPCRPISSGIVVVRKVQMTFA